MERIPEEHSPRLPPGTQVGELRVEAWQGQGAYGAVYRAVPVEPEQAGPVALKVALSPWDVRFAREADLLSRLSHPSIPRLLGRGVLRHPSGVELPYFVMEWIEGLPLYAWAQEHAASYRQLCQLLAQLARALAATHAAGSVHRDVKGDNVLVRHSDGRALLIDVGSGHFQGATRLTWQSLAPCTSAYRSAQASLFYIRLARARDSYYPPSAADDLYALGVTAYHLLMGQYPPAMEVEQDEEGSWRVWSPDPRPLLESNAQVQPVLREWIVRLLSDAPEARGTAEELAEALEAEAEGKVPVPQPAEPPASEVVPPAEVLPPAAEVLPLKAPEPTGTRELPERSRPQARARGWEPWLALAAAGVCVVLLWSAPPVAVLPGHVAASTSSAGPQVPDAGTAAVGDSSPTEPQASTPPPSEQAPIAQGPSAEPRLGPPRRQLQPDEKGRCPGRKQVAFEGGCWMEQPSMTAEACTESDYVLLKGKCYTPALEPRQKELPTSGPAKAR
jgi:serine/threonine protein kinase